MNDKSIQFDSFEERVEALGVLGVVVSQDGHEIGKRLWDEECRRNVYSASKSYTSCAVGIAIKEGLLTIDERLVDCFPDDLPETVSENLQKATVRDLLTMRLGQAQASLMSAQRPLYKETDWVRMSLAIPFADAPDSRFVYNNVGPYLAGILVQRRAGCNLVDYLMPRLFEPMGIHRPTWETDPQGNTFGAGGLMLTLSELHQLGILYLQDGMWNGRQIITQEWARESTRYQGDNSHDEYGYGYLFWGGPEGTFRADGKYSQLSIICKDRNAVISVVAECRNSEALMEAVFAEIYPQLQLTV